MKYFFILFFFCYSCKTVTIFPDENGPVWKGEAAEQVLNRDTSIKIVSYNIEYAIKIEEAIEELQSFADLKGADIILLQEMDTTGTRKIAETLDYNYVYYPAAYNKGNKLYGNAILSKWPIREEEKIILPHLQPLNKRQRIAMAATILFPDRKLRIYNTHQETFILKRSKRIEQAQLVANKVAALTGFDYIIVGGDFNTINRKNVRKMVEVFEQIGMTWTNPHTGYTATAYWGLIKPCLDHVFAQGFRVIDAGKIATTTASDHFPIWVELAWE